jgi:hypothetical protein
MTQQLEIQQHIRKVQRDRQPVFGGDDSMQRARLVWLTLGAHNCDSPFSLNLCR